MFTARMNHEDDHGMNGDSNLSQTVCVHLHKENSQGTLTLTTRKRLKTIKVSCGSIHSVFETECWSHHLWVFHDEGAVYMEDEGVHRHSGLHGVHVQMCRHGRPCRKSSPINFTKVAGKRTSIENSTLNVLLH